GEAGGRLALSSKEDGTRTEQDPHQEWLQRLLGPWAVRPTGRPQGKGPSAQSRRRGKARCSAGCGQKLIRQASEFPVAGRARSLPATVSCQRRGAAARPGAASIRVYRVCAIGDRSVDGGNSSALR